MHESWKSLITRNNARINNALKTSWRQDSRMLSITCQQFSWKYPNQLCKWKVKKPWQILRLYKQWFLFAKLSKTIKTYNQKILLQPFHSITIHIPVTFRLFCLRSIIPEQEETFETCDKFLYVHRTDRQQRDD